MRATSTPPDPAASASRIADRIRLLRPHQWLKNVLVFLPAIAGHVLSPAALGPLLAAFAGFSFAASAAYIVNDLVDIEHDRSHPGKSSRPLASGRVSPTSAIVTCVMLLAAAAGVALLAAPGFALALVLYLATTAAYTFFLKRIVAVDVVTLAGPYTLRVIAGGLAIAVPVSAWLLAFCLFLFFSLALIKRMTELIVRARQGIEQVAGRPYLASDLPIVAALAAASGLLSVLVLALYVDSPVVKVLYRYPQALWAACVVLLAWITRILILTARGRMHDDPILFAARDPVSLLCMLLVAAVMLAGAGLS